MVELESRNMRLITIRRFCYALTVVWAIDALTHQFREADIRTEQVTANISKFCSPPVHEDPQLFKSCMDRTAESLNLDDVGVNATIKALWPILAAWVVGYFIVKIGSWRTRFLNGSNVET